jgi:hypothetical protein
MAQNSVKTLARITDPTPMGTADALLPVYPFEQSLTGYKYHPSGPASNRKFKIGVSEGRGILITENFMTAHQDQSSVRWVERYENDPHKLPASKINGSKWNINIIGLVDIRFWLAGREDRSEYVEWNTVAMVTRTAGALCGVQMWIGSNTARIMPDPQMPGCFICKGDDGESVQVRGSR